MVTFWLTLLIIEFLMVESLASIPELTLDPSVATLVTSLFSFVIYEFLMVVRLIAIGIAAAVTITAISAFFMIFPLFLFLVDNACVATQFSR